MAKVPVDPNQSVLQTASQLMAVLLILMGKRPIHIPVSLSFSLSLYKDPDPIMMTSPSRHDHPSQSKDSSPKTTQQGGRASAFKLGGDSVKTITICKGTSLSMGSLYGPDEPQKRNA